MSEFEKGGTFASFMFEARTRGLTKATMDWLEAHSHLKGDEAAKAAALAYVQASRQPGCLVRVVEKHANAERLIDIAGRVTNLCLANGLFDENRTRTAFDADRSVIELLNGSGIEFVVES